jgi:ABC-type bacteriocin/lantibiotic exporter with double-glycine peptidase domain
MEMNDQQFNNNMDKNLLKIFCTRDSLWCVLLLIAQQTLVALSTIFIAELAKSIALGHISWMYLGLFIASLTLVYIPASLSRVYLEKVRYHAVNQYMQSFVHAHLGKIHLGADEEERKLPLVTSEGHSTINMASFFFYDMISIVLNVLASLIAISIVVHPDFFVSYIIGFILLAAFVWLTHRWIAYCAEQAQGARASFLAQLLKSWKNITINNDYNFKIWSQRFENTFEKAQEKNVHNIAVKQFISSFGLLISVFPLILTLVYLLYRFGDNIAFQALIVATLPRQIQMVQNMEIILQNITEWTDIKQRLIGLSKALIVAPQETDRRIQWPKLQFTVDGQPSVIRTFNDLKNLVGNQQIRRITIRGDNGTGKSTLLKTIKEKIGGYYLPASAGLSFAQNNWNSLSTGEQMLTALQEISGQDHADSLLLLDEWDANLDPENRNRLSSEIDLLATKIPIIEVVHR